LSPQLQRAMAPKQAIDAQEHLMSDLMTREHGNLWVAARDYDGSGAQAIAYANSLVGPNAVGGGVAGGSGTQPIPITGNLTLHVVWPNGMQQDVKVPVRPTFAGVAGGHIAPDQTHNDAIAHPTSNNRPHR